MGFGNEFQLGGKSQLVGNSNLKQARQIFPEI